MLLFIPWNKNNKKGEHAWMVGYTSAKAATKDSGQAGQKDYVTRGKSKKIFACGWQNH